MLANYNGIDMVVLDDDFIMSEFCYYNGLNCLNCVDADDCICMTLTKDDIQIDDLNLEE